MSHASSWSLGEADARRIQTVLTRFLGEAGARTTLLVDRNGQLLTQAGDPPLFDHVAFASLTLRMPWAMPGGTITTPPTPTLTGAAPASVHSSSPCSTNWMCSVSGCTW